jgi:ribosomal protein L37E
MTTATREECKNCGRRSLIQRTFSYDYCTSCGWESEDNCCELQAQFGSCLCQCHKH